MVIYKISSQKSVQFVKKLISTFSNFSIRLKNVGNNLKKVFKLSRKAINAKRSNKNFLK